MDSPWMWKKWHIEIDLAVGIKIDADDDDSDWLKMMGHWNSNHLNNFSKTNDDVDDDDDKTTTKSCSDRPAVVNSDVDGSEDDFVDDDGDDDEVDDSNDRSSMMNSKVMTIDWNSTMNSSNVDVDWRVKEHDSVDNDVDPQQINTRSCNDKILSIDEYWVKSILCHDGLSKLYLVESQLTNDRRRVDKVEHYSDWFVRAVSSSDSTVKNWIDGRMVIHSIPSDCSWPGEGNELWCIDWSHESVPEWFCNR